MQPQRVSNDQIIAAYQRNGSVWKAARELGICGQSVWERLRALGFKLPSSQWTDEELEEAKKLAGNVTIGEIAARLGRTYAGVACKLSELGVAAPPKRQPKVPRGAGLNKATMHKLMPAAMLDERPLTRFCRSHGFNVDTFALAAQKYEPSMWTAYIASRSPLPSKQCEYCERDFIPSTGKQRTCSRKCQRDARADRQYFGGKRKLTVGLAERVCQCCGRKDVKGLSSHHVLGKQNDPENAYLLALCPGCHSAVGTLANANFTTTEQGWENLIGLVLLRKATDLGRAHCVGTHVAVDIDWVIEADEFGGTIAMPKDRDPNDMPDDILPDDAAVNVSRVPSEAA